jgi:cell shape-determining protein MreD
MSHIFLRFISNPLLIFILVLFIAVQTTVFSYYPMIYFQPSLALLAVVWIGLKRRFEEGGWMVLALGYVVELFSSVPQGVVMLSLILTYFWVRLANRWILLSVDFAVVGLTLFSSLLMRVLTLILLKLLDVDGEFFFYTWHFLILGAGIDAVLGIWAYDVFAQYDWKTFKDRRANQFNEEDQLAQQEWM